MYHRHGNRTTIAHVLLRRENPTKNKYGTIVEQYYCVLRKRRASFPGTTTCPWKLSTRLYRITYGFPEQDAADAASCAPFGPSRITRPFPSSKHHKYNKHGYENALTRFKDEDLTTTLSPSTLCPVFFK